MSIYQRWAELSDREAIGEALTDDERAFLREHARVDPLASAEMELWEAMSVWPQVEDAAGDRALAERAVRTAAAQRALVAGTTKKRGSVAPWIAAGFAAAAGVALYVARPQNTVQVAAGPQAAIEYVASGARVAGAPAENGTRIPLGTEVEAVGGAVCVQIEPKMHACLPNGAKVRLTKFGGAERQVELVSGRVAVALFPLAPGERFSVVANGATSTAVGTAYTVELTQAGVRTVVHEGKVAVSQGGASEAITAHRIGLATPSGVTAAPLTDHAATETEDWVALAKLAGRDIESPWEVVKAAPEESAEPVAAKEPVRRPVAHPVAAPEAPAPVAAPEAAAEHAAPAESPSGLFSAARQALREQRWADATAAYRNLIANFPGSAEARTALVPLAKLELDRVGQPKAALEHLDAYIAGGGSLDVEARLTRIRAYRSLGRAADEARAIDEFLADHPNSLDSGALRTRRVALPTH